MGVAAFVLIETEVGAARAVAAACEALEFDQAAITSVSVVTGPYSVIVRMEAAEVATLGRLVTETLHAIPGVRHTVTCIELD